MALGILDGLSLQQEFFASGETLRLEFRLQALDKLRETVKKYENKLIIALKQDLGKSEFETYMTELTMVYGEIDLALRYLPMWSKPEKVRGSLTSLWGQSIIYKQPLGRVLIISTWNYPIQLALVPLISAIAAGNCVTLKLSEYTSATSEILQQIISEVFEPGHVQVVLGDKTVGAELLTYQFDHIFFTGSSRVGKIVMASAAKYLTPVTLELGGKNPSLIHESADLVLAAKKIAWGKILNAGQVCISPDYILVPHHMYDQFVCEVQKFLQSFLVPDALTSTDYCRIINREHFNRLVSYLSVSNLNGGTRLYGGEQNQENLTIAPAIVGFDSIAQAKGSLLMQEEIFGPIIPVIQYQDWNEAIDFIKSGETPLALYLFAKNKALINQVCNTLKFGGGCINDVISHVANSNLPFGGVGNSGIGCYHGKFGFETFTHRKSVLKDSGLDTKIKYPPYGDKIKYLRKIFK